MAFQRKLGEEQSLPWLGRWRKVTQGVKFSSRPKECHQGQKTHRCRVGRGCEEGQNECSWRAGTKSTPALENFQDVGLENVPFCKTEFSGWLPFLPNLSKRAKAKVTRRGSVCLGWLWAVCHMPMLMVNLCLCV